MEENNLCLIFRMQVEEVVVPPDLDEKIRKIIENYAIQNDDKT